MRDRLAESEMQAAALENVRDWLTPHRTAKTKARVKVVVSMDAIRVAGLALLICLLAIPVAEWQEKVHVLYTLWASLCGQAQTFSNVARPDRNAGHWLLLNPGFLVFQGMSSTWIQLKVQASAVLTVP